MSAWDRTNACGCTLGPRTLAGLVLAAALFPALAQFLVAEDLIARYPWSQAAPVYVIPGPSESSTLYADGSQIIVETKEVWHPMCGSVTTGVTSDDVRRWAERHNQLMATEPTIAVDTPKRGGGINIVFNANASVPTEAVASLALAEAYLESQFSDPITVTISVSFQDMGGGGTIGGTSPVYVANVAYATSRDGLINGMDATDVIQTWLPSGSTVPVWYSGPTGAVTNENYVDWTRANYRAAIGTVSGNAASMSFNTQFAPYFDYDPSNGVGSSQLSFVDVVVHETGHALGFVSGADNFSGMNFLAIDLYRFQRSTNNPSTYAEFQTTTRLVSAGIPSGDDVNTDLIVAEYRMEDAADYQASHWKQSPPYIGIMEPAASDGETHYPNYFSTADLAAFDAVGYEPCTIPNFTQMPSSRVACSGGETVFTASADGAVSYQWRRGVTPLTDGGNISGALTDTLTINPVDPNDADLYYNVIAYNACGGSSQSYYASLSVGTGPIVVDHPITHTGNIGHATTFTTSAVGVGTLSYRWRKNGIELSDVGNISGSATTTLSINPVGKTDVASYDVVVTDDCTSLPSDPASLWVAGDTNCDGIISYADINPFVLAMAGELEYQAQYPNCLWSNADANADAVVSYADINAFVALLALP